MGEVIYLNKILGKRLKKSNDELDKLQESLENIDVDVVYRAINPDEDTEKVNNVLLSKYNEKMANECFETFYKAVEVKNRTIHDWGE